MSHLDILRESQLGHKAPASLTKKPCGGGNDHAAPALSGKSDLTETAMRVLPKMGLAEAPLRANSTDSFFRKYPEVDTAEKFIDWIVTHDDMVNATPAVKKRLKIVFNTMYPLRKKNIQKASWVLAGLIQAATKSVKELTPVEYGKLSPSPMGDFQALQSLGVDKIPGILTTTKP